MWRNRHYRKFAQNPAKLNGMLLRETYVRYNIFIFKKDSNYLKRVAWWIGWEDTFRYKNILVLR